MNWSKSFAEFYKWVGLKKNSVNNLYNKIKFILGVKKRVNMGVYKFII